MGPELVRSPRSRGKPELCPIHSPIDTTPERQCGTTLGVSAVARRLTREACERNANPTCPLQTAMDASRIELANPTFSEQSTPPTQTLLPPSDHHQARCVPIETVNQMQVGIVLPQSRDQGILLMLTDSRLDQQTSRLVDDHNPGIAKTLLHN